MEIRKAGDIKNLLLKIVIPLVFPLAGSIICDLITNRANRDCDTDSSYSSIQLDPFYGSSQEGEEEEMNSFRRTPRNEFVQAENSCSTDIVRNSEGARRTPRAEEIRMARVTENPSAIAVEKLQNGHNVVEEMESLKCMVSALEERAGNIELQFHDYCDMKEQESTYQKMQIMCLGMKLELLEAQNQRLEAAAEEFATMRAKLNILQNKFTKISKKIKQNSDAIDGKLLILDAKEAEMTTRCANFEQYMEEMKQLTLQLQKERGSNYENVEVVVERSMRKLSSNKDLLDQLETLRDRWAADMEEMIYLGWITAWLQHELLILDSGATAIGNVNDSALPPPAQKKGEKMMAAVASSNEVELCKASSNASSEMHCMESCMDAAGCRKANWILARPRLFHKLKGWAKGTGKSRRPGRIKGSSSQI